MEFVEKTSITVTRVKWSRNDACSIYISFVLIELTVNYSQGFPLINAKESIDKVSLRLLIVIMDIYIRIHSILSGLTRAKSKKCKV